MISHYSRTNAPNRRYLNLELTIKGMHGNYIYIVELVSYSTYKTVFDLGNIGFSQPSVDECPLCLSFESHSKDGDLHDVENCDKCKEFKEHKKKYQEARKEYQKETPEVSLY